jgi:hypothetical protein
VQKLALTLVPCLDGLGGEHQGQRVEDVRTGLGTIMSVAEDARYGRDRGNDPSIVAVLVEDRQVQRLPTPKA